MRKKIGRFWKAHSIKIYFTIILLIIFIFLRWVSLQDSLLFYNDMGRDFVELIKWSETGKPPLLGPQTSVISYNQSAWYFYFLFPVFLLSGYSALSSTATIILFAITTFLLILWQTRNKPFLFWLTICVGLLMAVHPQFIIQNRFVWNPSFVPYFLFLSLISGLFLNKEFSYRYAAIFWLGLAFAVGFSYSSLPIALCMGIYILLKNRTHILNHLASAFLAAFIVLLPTIAFEIRHSFALTKLFLEGQTTPQAAQSLSVRFDQLLKLIFPARTILESKIIGIIILGSLVYGFSISKRNKSKNLPEFLILTGLLVILFTLQLILPINLEKHYVFPLLLSLFSSIAVLPNRIRIPLITSLILFWTQPFFLNSYTSSPVRSIENMESCYIKYCRDHSAPMYVSMESGILVGYHNAPEHQFFLRKAGCNILDIEASQDQADSMLVINDAGKFTPGKSGYRELTLFGDYTVGPLTQCSENLSILEINRPTETSKDKEIFQPQ